MRPLLTLAALALPSLAGAATLPALFADHMVLQQNTTIKVWGWGKPKEPIAVVASWAEGDTIRTEGAPDATWSVMLQTPEGSMDTYTIDVLGWGDRHIADVMVGEVLLCSGQSNMEWSVGAGFEGSDKVTAEANEDHIRMFKVDYRTSEVPLHDVSGQWAVATPQSVGNFSAIGYMVAKQLSEATGMPVGVVNSSWGGTPIECWTPALSYEMCDYLRSANDELHQGEWGPCRPGRIYNAMVYPFADYKFAACLWYQGEENTANPKAYTDMFYTFAAGYRDLFGANLPIIYAQIAPYEYGSGRGVEIRERQRRAMGVDNTAMVVIGELGDPQNIHPQKKVEAAQRFGSALLKLAYGRTDLHYEAPLFESAEYVKNKAIITFSNAEGLHTADGKAPDMFEVAGADGVFRAAKAKIVKGRVELTCPTVKAPTMVRYAWADAAMPNLRNAYGVQASCFSTQDDF